MSFGLRPKMASTLSLNGNKLADLIGVDGVPDQKGEETLAYGISVSIQWYSEYEEKLRNPQCNVWHGVIQRSSDE